MSGAKGAQAKEFEVFHGWQKGSGPQKMPGGREVAKKPKELLKD